MESKDIKRSKAVDTGMALTLICLIVALATGLHGWVVAAVVVLVVNMTVPRLFIPASKVWFGLSIVLGTVVSKIILSLVFFGLLTPLALIRRVLGHDPMMLGKWKSGDDSAFVVREHTFEAKEIELPY